MMVTASSRPVTILRWIARLLAAALVLFWGAFFLEHLSAWFVRSLPQTPPPSVWLAQFLHLLILVGLVVGFRWERAGGVLVIVASVLFFWDKAPVYILPTIIPGVLWLYCWYRDQAAWNRAG